VRRFAPLVLLTFACATVRVPVSPAGEPADAPGAIAPPVAELWLESSGPIGETERAQAEGRAHAALDSALRGRRIAGSALGASDPVLFVRERAVGVTDARRSQQTWAKVGLVVGIVVVVAVVIVALAAGHKSGAPASVGSHAAPAPLTRAAGVPVRAAPAVASPAVASPAAGTIGRVQHLPAPRIYYGPAFPIFFDFGFYLPPRPLVLLPEGPDGAYVADDPVSPLAPGPPPPPEEEDAQPPPEPAVPAPPPAPPMELPPLSDEASFAVGERGFFAGPHTAVQLDVVDRATGRVLWSQTAADDADPMDPEAMKKLIDGALEGAAWAR
jgi:hypothetical protein